MASLEELNELARGATDFRIQSFDSSKLLIIGSFDLCYYHDIELAFSEVSFIRCPVYFDNPVFSDSDSASGGRRFIINTDEGQFEIVADAWNATIGKVYHYDHGHQLQPGERIADWIHRPNA